MRFSDVYKQSFGQWAPNGQHLAAAAQNRVLVREAEAMKLVQVYICVDKVERVEWSPNSEYLLTEVARRGIVQVWSLGDSEWACRIDEGLAGVAHARWGISSDHIFIYSEFQLYLSVWKLDEQSRAIQIRHPKYSHKGLAFSRNSRWLALLRRSNCRDSVVVHSCDASFARLSEIAVTGDFGDLAWAADDSSIVLWDRPARSARFLWYSPRGELLAQVDECGLLRNAFSSPMGQLLAGGCFDGCVHLVSTESRKVLTHWMHDLKLACAEAAEEEVVVLREEVSTSGDGLVQFTRLSNPASVRIPEDRPGQEAATLDPDGVPRQGVSSAVWSPDERFLATRRDGASATLWIWDVGRLALAAVLIHRTPIRSVVWDPSGSARGNSARLAISTADPLLFIWSAAEVENVKVVSSPLSMTRLQWRADGTALLSQERDRACICFPGSPAISSFSPPRHIIASGTEHANSIDATEEAPSSTGGHQEARRSTRGAEARSSVGSATINSQPPPEPMSELHTVMSERETVAASNDFNNRVLHGGAGGSGALAMAALAGDTLMGSFARQDSRPVPLAAV